MTDIIPGEPLNPNCPMGQFVYDRRYVAAQQGCVHVVEMMDICAKRANDRDPEVRKLVRGAVYAMAKSAGIDLTAMPWIESTRKQ